MVPPPPPCPCPEPPAPANKEEENDDLVTGWMSKRGRHSLRVTPLYVSLNMATHIFSMFESEQSRKPLKRLYIHPHGISLDRSKVDQALKKNDRAKGKYEFKLKASDREFVFFVEVLDTAKKWVDAFELTLQRARLNPFGQMDMADYDWDDEDDDDENDTDPERMRQREERYRKREELRKHKETQRRRVNELKARRHREELQRSISIHPFWCWVLRGDVPQLLPPNDSQLQNLDENLPHVILVVPYEGDGEPNVVCWQAKSDLIVDNGEAMSPQGQIAQKWADELNEVVHLDDEKEAGVLRIWAFHDTPEHAPHQVNDTMSADSIEQDAGYVVRYNPLFFDGDDERNMDVRPILYTMKSINIDNVTSQAVECWTEMLNIFRVAYYSLSADEEVQSDEEQEDQPQGGHTQFGMNLEELKVLRAPVLPKNLDSAIEAWSVASGSIPTRVKHLKPGHRRRWHKKTEIPTVAEDDCRRIFSEDQAYVLLATSETQEPTLLVLVGYPRGLAAAEDARSWARSLTNETEESEDEGDAEQGPTTAVAHFCGWHGADDPSQSRRSVWTISEDGQPEKLSNDFCDFDEASSYVVLVASSKRSNDAAVFTIDGLKADPSYVTATRAFADVLDAVRSRDAPEGAEDVVRECLFSSVIGEAGVHARVWQVGSEATKELDGDNIKISDDESFTVMLERGDGQNHVLVISGQPYGDQWNEAATNWAAMLGAAEHAAREGRSASRYAWEVVGQSSHEKTEGEKEEPAESALPSLMPTIHNGLFIKDNSYIIVAPAEDGLRPAVFTMDGADCTTKSASIGHRWANELARSIAKAAGETEQDLPPQVARPFPSAGSGQRRFWICVTDDQGNTKVQSVSHKKSSTLSNSDAYIVLIMEGTDPEGNAYPASVHALCGEACSEEERATALRWARNLASLLTSSQQSVEGEDGKVTYTSTTWGMLQSLETLELKGDEMRTLTMAVSQGDANDEERSVLAAVHIDEDGGAFAVYSADVTNNVRAATSAWLSMLVDASLCSKEPEHDSSLAQTLSMSRRELKAQLEEGKAAVFAVGSDGCIVEALAGDEQRYCSVDNAYIVCGVEGHTGKRFTFTVIGANAASNMKTDVETLAQNTITYAAAIQSVITLADSDIKTEDRFAVFCINDDGVATIMNPEGGVPERALSEKEAYVVVDYSSGSSQAGIATFIGTGASTGAAAGAHKWADLLRNHFGTTDGFGATEGGSIPCAPRLFGSDINAFGVVGGVCTASTIESLAAKDSAFVLRAGSSSFTVFTNAADPHSAQAEDVSRWASLMSISDDLTRRVWSISNGNPTEVSNSEPIVPEGDSAFVVLEPERGILALATPSCSNDNYRQQDSFVAAISTQLRNSLTPLNEKDGIDINAVMGDKASYDCVWVIAKGQDPRRLVAEELEGLRSMPSETLNSSGLLCLRTGEGLVGDTLFSLVLANKEVDKDLASSVRSLMQQYAKFSHDVATSVKNGEAYVLSINDNGMERYKIDEMYSKIAQGNEDTSFVVVAPTSAQNYAVYSMDATGKPTSLADIFASGISQQLLSQGLLDSPQAKGRLPPVTVGGANIDPSTFHIYSLNDGVLGSDQGAGALRALSAGEQVLLSVVLPTADGAKDGKRYTMLIQGYSGAIDGTYAQILDQKESSILYLEELENTVNMSNIDGHAGRTYVKPLIEGGVIIGYDICTEDPGGECIIITRGEDGTTNVVVRYPSGIDSEISQSLQSVAQMISERLKATDVKDISALSALCPGCIVYAINSDGDVFQVTPDVTPEMLEGCTFVAVGSDGVVQVLCVSDQLTQSAESALSKAKAEEIADHLTKMRAMMRAGSSFAVDSNFVIYDINDTEFDRNSSLLVFNGETRTLTSVAGGQVQQSSQMMTDFMMNSLAIMVPDVSQSGDVSKILSMPLISSYSAGDKYYIDVSGCRLVPITADTVVPPDAICVVKDENGNFTTFMGSTQGSDIAKAIATLSAGIQNPAALLSIGDAGSLERRVFTFDADGLPTDSTQLIEQGMRLNLGQQAFIVAAPATDGSGSAAVFAFVPSASGEKTRARIAGLFADMRAQAPQGHLTTLDDVLAGVVQGDVSQFTLIRFSDDEYHPVVLGPGEARVLDEACTYAFSDPQSHTTAPCVGRISGESTQERLREFTELSQAATQQTGLFADNGAHKIWIISPPSDDASDDATPVYRQMTAEEVAACMKSGIVTIPPHSAAIIANSDVAYATCLMGSDCATCVRRALPNFARILKASGHYDAKDALLQDVLPVPKTQFVHIQPNYTNGIDRTSTGSISSSSSKDELKSARLTSIGGLLVDTSTDNAHAYGIYSMDQLIQFTESLETNNMDHVPMYAAVLKAQTTLCVAAPQLHVFSVDLASGKAKGRKNASEKPIAKLDMVASTMSSIIGSGTAALMTNGCDGVLVLQPNVDPSQGGADISGLCFAMQQLASVMAGMKPPTDDIVPITFQSCQQDILKATSVFRISMPFNEDLNDTLGLRVESVPVTEELAASTVPQDAAYVVVYRNDKRANATFQLITPAGAPVAARNEAMRAVWCAQAMLDAESKARGSRYVIQLPVFSTMGTDVEKEAQEENSTVEEGYKIVPIANVLEWLDAIRDSKDHTNCYAVYSMEDNNWFVISSQQTTEFQIEDSLSNPLNAARTAGAMIASRMLVDLRESRTAGGLVKAPPSSEIALTKILGSRFTVEHSRYTRVFQVSDKAGRLTEIQSQEFKRMEDEKVDLMVQPHQMYLFATGLGMAKQSFSFSLAGPLVFSGAEAGQFSASGTASPALAAILPVMMAQLSSTSTLVRTDQSAAWKFQRFGGSAGSVTPINLQEIDSLRKLDSPVVFAAQPAGQSQRPPIFSMVPVSTDMVKSGDSDDTALNEAVVHARSAASMVAYFRADPRNGTVLNREQTKLSALVNGCDLSKVQAWIVSDGTCSPIDDVMSDPLIDESQTLLLLVPDENGIPRPIVVAGCVSPDEDVLSAQGWSSLLYALSSASGSPDGDVNAIVDGDVTRHIWHSKGGIPEPYIPNKLGILDEDESYVIQTECNGKVQIWVALGSTAAPSSASAARAYAQMLANYKHDQLTTSGDYCVLPALKGTSTFIPVGDDGLPRVNEAHKFEAETSVGIVIQQPADGSKQRFLTLTPVDGSHMAVGSARNWANALAESFTGGEDGNTATVVQPRGKNVITVSQQLSHQGIANVIPNCFAVAHPASGTSFSMIDASRADDSTNAPVRLFTDLVSKISPAAKNASSTEQVLSHTLPALEKCFVWTIDADGSLVTVHQSGEPVQPAVYKALQQSCCVIYSTSNSHLYSSESGNASIGDREAMHAWSECLQEEVLARQGDITRRSETRQVVWSTRLVTTASGRQIRLPYLMPENDTGAVLRRVDIQRETGQPVKLQGEGDEPEALVILKRMKCSEDAAQYFDGLDHVPVFDTVSTANAAGSTVSRVAEVLTAFLDVSGVGESRASRMARENEEKLVWTQDLRTVEGRTFPTRELRMASNGSVMAYVVGAHDAMNENDATCSAFIPGMDMDDEDGYLLHNDALQPVPVNKAGVPLFDSRFSYILVARTQPGSATSAPDRASLQASDGYIIKTWRGSRSSAVNAAAARTWSFKLAARMADFAQVPRSALQPTDEVDGSESQLLMNIFSAGGAATVDIEEAQDQSSGAKHKSHGRAGPAPLQLYVIAAAGYADSLVARLPIRVPRSRTGAPLSQAELAALGIDIHPDWKDPAWVAKAPPAFTYMPPVELNLEDKNTPADELEFYSHWRGIFIVANKRYIIVYTPPGSNTPSSTIRARAMQLVGALKAEYPLAKHLVIGSVGERKGAHKDDEEDSEETVRIFYKLIGGTPTRANISSAGASNRDATQPEPPELYIVDPQTNAYRQVIAEKAKNVKTVQARTVTTSGQRLARSMLRPEPDPKTGEVQPQVYHLFCHTTLFQYEAPGLVKSGQRSEPVPVPAWMSAAARIRARQEIAARNLNEIQIIKLTGKPTDDMLIPLAFESAFAVWGAMPPVASKLSGQVDDEREKPDERLKRNVNDVISAFKRLRQGSLMAYVEDAPNGVALDEKFAAKLAQYKGKPLVLAKLPQPGTDSRAVYLIVPDAPRTAARGRKAPVASEQDVMAWMHVLTGALGQGASSDDATEAARIPRIMFAPAKADITALVTDLLAQN